MWQYEACRQRSCVYTTRQCVSHRAAKNDVFRIHMHENGIVIVSKTPEVCIEIKNVSHPRNTLFFAERVYAHIGGQCMASLPKAYDFDTFGVFCKFLYPTHKKPENRIIRINCLCNNEQFHARRNVCIRSRAMRGGISPTSARCSRAVSRACRGSSCLAALSSRNPTMLSESAVGSATGTERTSL